MEPESVAISVVITCYNYAHYVGKAIDSVLSQSRAAEEIVVIDDGSTDNSWDIISAYGDKIRAIRKQNEGYKATINRGYSETRSAIVMFLDADDVLYPTALERVAQAWRPGLAKVQFDLDVIDHEDRRLGRRFCNFAVAPTAAEIGDQFARNGTYIWPVTSGNAHARAFLSRVMPLIPPVGHDGVLNTIAPLYGEVVTIAEPLGQYRLHGKNMSLANGQGRSGRHPDFARQIGFRHAEFEILRTHAANLGVALPNGNLLDNELVFVNYRLMARKIGQQYARMADDSAVRLWYRGITLASGGHGGLRSKLAHLVWLTAILIAPSSIARSLIVLRFNRAEVVRSLLARLRAPIGRESSAS